MLPRGFRTFCDGPDLPASGCAACVAFSSRNTLLACTDVMLAASLQVDTPTANHQNATQDAGAIGPCLDAQS